MAFGHFVRRFDEHRVAKRIREYRGLPPKDAALLTGKVSTKAKLKLSDEHRVGVTRARCAAACACEREFTLGCVH